MNLLVLMLIIKEIKCSLVKHDSDIETKLLFNKNKFIEIVFFKKKNIRNQKLLKTCIGTPKKLSGFSTNIEQ